MKVKGYFVNPLEVEGELYKIEGCLEAKVFVNAKETLCAMMVFNRGINMESLQEKTTKALQHLDRWSIPKQYYVVKEIPKNEMRKYDIKRITQRLDQQEIEFLKEWSL
jgi:acyl-coenzyme A synthetase/AMP-(fatty) acid ligase